MADDVDLTHERLEREMQLLLAARAIRQQGRDECKKCGDSISALRKDLGADCCLPCQEREEFDARVRRGKA